VSTNRILAVAAAIGVLTIMAVVVLGVALIIEGGRLSKWQQDNTLYTDCFPQFMTCSVADACAIQRGANADGLIVSGNYPGCPEPQHLPADKDPWRLYP